jgi:formylglycine-generating enzyme required for sulfatase activity
VANYWTRSKVPKEVFRNVTVAVNTLYPNPWGLNHIHGNVGEWCEDEYYDSYRLKSEALKRDGSIPWTEVPTGIGSNKFLGFVEGSNVYDLRFDHGQRILRGGSYNEIARDIRSAFRGRFFQFSRHDINEFRLVFSF